MRGMTVIVEFSLHSLAGPTIYVKNDLICSMKITHKGIITFLWNFFKDKKKMIKCEKRETI